MDSMNHDSDMHRLREQILSKDERIAQLENKVKEEQSTRYYKEAELGRANDQISRLQDVSEEKAMLQAKLDQLTSLPFFKDTVNDSTFNENASLKS